MPRNVIVFVVASLPSSRNALTLFSPTLTMSWSTWPLLKKIVSHHIASRRSERHQQDPRVLSHRGIVWCRTLHPDLHREMPQWAGLSLGRLSSKEDSDLQCLSSSSSLAQGQMPHSSIVGMVIIDASTAEVLLTLPRIVATQKELSGAELQPEQQQGQGQEANGASPARAS